VAGCYGNYNVASQHVVEVMGEVMQYLHILVDLLYSGLQSLFFQTPIIGGIDYVTPTVFVWFALWFCGFVGVAFDKFCRKILHRKSIVVSLYICTFVVVLAVVTGFVSGGVHILHAVYAALILMGMFSLATYPYLYLKAKLAATELAADKAKVYKSSFVLRAMKQSWFLLWNPRCLLLFLPCVLAYESLKDAVVAHQNVDEGVGYNYEEEDNCAYLDQMREQNAMYRDLGMGFYDDPSFDDAYAACKAGEEACMNAIDDLDYNF